MATKKKKLVKKPVKKPAKKPAKKTAKSLKSGWSSPKKRGGRPKEDKFAAIPLPTHAPVPATEIDVIKAAFPEESLHTANPLFVEATRPVFSVLQIDRVFIDADGFVGVVFFEAGGRFVAPAGWMLANVVRRPDLEQALGVTPIEPVLGGAGFLDADISDAGIRAATEGTAADVVPEPAVESGEVI